jgi:hypothetical protein
MRYCHCYLVLLLTYLLKVLGSLSLRVARYYSISVCHNLMDNNKYMPNKPLDTYGDDILSHKTLPMLSLLLISYLKNCYIWLKSHGIPEVDFGATHDNDEPEQVHMWIATNDDGELLDANQVHHYIYHDNSLCHMNFYDFSHCIRLELISKSAKNKHTFETCLGISRRHPLKIGHPSHQMHVLVEHTNEERGDCEHKFVPHVIRMSIP